MSMWVVQIQVSCPNYILQRGMMLKATNNFKPLHVHGSTAKQIILASYVKNCIYKKHVITSIYLIKHNCNWHYFHISLHTADSLPRLIQMQLPPSYVSVIGCSERPQKASVLILY